MNYNKIFEKLWTIYTGQNPGSRKVWELLSAEGETIINDHVAFRTFNDQQINIDVLSKEFIASGYVYKGDYHFTEKKLYAKHFEHKSDPKAPRVFISQLITAEFSPFLQLIVKEWIRAISPEKLSSPALICSGNLSGVPSFEVFEKLRKESEYAAWLYVNGFCANHFTVSVNYLKKYDGIAKINAFLKQNGFLMNDAGGEIQGSPEELLEQSSIRAGMVNTKFTEGNYEVPGCYYEFAKRYPDRDGRLYSGFIAKSADKIFQSTDFYKQ
ncbi:MAG: DUF1338 domain-containing protein [Bacteroidetes bacterium]|nr:DUF1338 domain-containing protein [Bacteroidota bacterium]